MAKKQVKQMDMEEYMQKMRERGYNDNGEFIPDSTPIAPPIGYKRQPTMVEIIRDMVRGERLAEEARQAGMETFEESEDFDIGDDGEDLRSGFENDFDPPLSEVREVVEAERAAKAPPPAEPAEPAPDAPPEASNDSE